MISPAPFIFYKYGAFIRARSKFSPSPDLRMREIVEVDEEKEAGQFIGKTCVEKQQRTQSDVAQREASTVLEKELPAMV